MKLSRDATNLSKKVIFLLHRIATEESGQEDVTAVAVLQSRKKLAEIMLVFDCMRIELQDGRFWRHQKTISAAIQEYIEALSFAHYLEHDTLLTFEQVQKNFVSREGIPVR